MSIQPIVFRSMTSQLFVSFPPEQFGMGKNAEGNPAAYRNTKFHAGMLLVDPDKQEILLERLRKHSACKPQEEAGPGEYWEEKPEDTLATGMYFGDPTASDPEGGLTGEDNIDLALLVRCSVQIPPASAPKAMDALKRCMDRFNVLGVPRPTDDASIKSLRAHIILFLDLLENKGLWSENDGRGDSK